MTPADIEIMQEVHDRLDAAEHLERAGESLDRALAHHTASNVRRLSSKIRQQIAEDRQHFWKTDVAAFAHENRIPLNYLLSSNALRAARRAREKLMVHLSHARNWPVPKIALTLNVKIATVSGVLTRNPIPGNGPVPESGGAGDHRPSGIFQNRRSA